MPAILRIFVYQKYCLHYKIKPYAQIEPIVASWWGSVAEHGHLEQYAVMTIGV